MTREEELRQMRGQIYLAARSAGAGHLASAFSCVEILYALYNGGVMRHNPADPRWDGRDLFTLSKGHGSLALYAALAKAGYFNENELYRFYKPGGILGGEPHTLEVPGIDASTGSLGHGLPISLGMALALKADGRPNKVYCLTGDGECQEGSIWEAVISAPGFGLDNLYMIIDSNRVQKMDFIEKIVPANALGEQIARFGWQVKRANGHDVDDIKAKLQGEWESGKPRCLIADTVKGKGVSLMEDNPGWHWRMPNRKERKVFCCELGISETELETAGGGG
jgi:transketolase